MGSRTMPTYCEHGVCIDGGDFVEAENCPQCHAVNVVCPCCAMAQKTITRLKQRVEALEKLLDPETLARKIGDWDFAHNDDYFCFKFGGDGDNGEMLIDALAALLQETDQ